MIFFPAIYLVAVSPDHFLHALESVLESADLWFFGISIHTL